MNSNDLRPSPSPYHRAIVRQLQRVRETATDGAVEAWRSGRQPSPHWQEDRLTVEDTLLREEILENTTHPRMAHKVRS